MSDNIFHNDFSAGWIPSDNYINGRRNGLLQMDNLCLDDNGALTSVKGPNVLSAALADKPHTLFSATVSGVQKTLAALANGSVVEGADFSNVLIPAGVPVARAAFGNVLDQILICAGSVNKKWDGTTLRNAGILAPGAAPTVAANASIVLSVANLDGSNKWGSNWTIVDGTLISDGAFAFDVNPAALNNLGQITTDFGAPFDTGNYPNGAAAAAEDIFQMPMTFSDGTQVQGIQVNFYNDDGTGQPDYNTRLYFNFDQSNVAFPIGAGTVTLQCFRGEFDNNNPAVPFSAWKTIQHIIIFFFGTGFVDYTFQDMQFIGSTIAVLNGNFQYLQVNVYDTGKYLAQSPVSPISTTVSVANANIRVTPYTTGLDPQVNEIWIFRTNIATEGGVFYQVKVLTTPYAAFDDGLTDSFIEQEDITANLFLTNLSDLTSGILDIIGIYFDRVIYFDAKNIYFSPPLNADSIDTRKTVTYSGNTSEVYLWARKVTNTVIIVATDLDMYELTGTYAELPDGTLDISFRPLAVKNPAVSIAAVAYSSSVLYQAADGWRVFDGVTSTPMSDSFDALYKNIQKYGYAPITDGYFSGQVFAGCAIANKKLYITQRNTSGIYKCFVFDFTRKVWNVYTDGLYALQVKDDGTLFGSNFTDNKIYTLDQNTGNLTAAKALFTVETNGTPRNRKDPFTFKLNINTNGRPIKFYLIRDFQQYNGDANGILIATVTTTSLVEVIFDISAIVPISKAFQIQMIGIVDGLVMTDYSIDFATRPTQLTHLRKIPDNFGSAAIKQLVVLPFTMDTLGNDVTFSPIADGTALPGQVFNSTDKKTFFYYIPEDLFVIDIGGTLDGELFEFYDWLQPELVEVLQVTRKRDNIGPLEFTKNARMLAFRFRLFPLGSKMRINVQADEVTQFTKDLTVTPLKELVYEVLCPRGTQGTSFQFEFLTSDDMAFARNSFEYKAVISGSQSDNGWRPVKAPGEK